MHDKKGEQMSETPIKTHIDGHILEVTIDRPKANAIDLATSRIMGEVFRGSEMTQSFGFDPDGDK